MKRYGQIIGVKLEQIDAYKRIHAQVWPEVLAMIEACHISTGYFHSKMKTHQA